MVTHGVDHECTNCGTTSAYHKFDDESQGDVVDAYCPNCGEDTDHEIQ